jgi:hypothetical protein
LARKLIALKFNQNVFNFFCKIYTPKFLGCYNFANLHYKGFKIIFRTEILQFLALNIAQLTCEAQDRSVVWIL